MRNNKHKRIGEVHKTNNCGNVEIIDYVNNKNITVRFDNGVIKTGVNYFSLKKKEVSSKLYPSIYGVGCFGAGVYDSTNNKRAYHTWHDMLERCYSDNKTIKQESYVGCDVDVEWHNFQNFAKWFDKNYYEIESEKIVLDKDILTKNNKTYSKSQCIFTPEIVNLAFISRKKDRGDYPIGVSFSESKRKFCVFISMGRDRQYLGSFKTPEEAFYVYKEAKEGYIKDLADMYKDKIPQNLYKAMYAWEVEITD